MPTTTVGKPYLDLIRRFPLRPLRSEADLDGAIAVIDRLTDRGNLSAQEEDYLEVLAGLVEAYEAEHDPLPRMTPVEALRFLIEQNRLTQAELAQQTGLAVATLSEILNEKRGISPKARAALAQRFRVSPALFVS